MASLKQIEANRRNALKSTGPRTEAGKVQSRMNALKTGIDALCHVLPGESPDAFAALTFEYYEHHRPATPEQRALVDILISNEWLLRRLRRVEHQIWEAEFEVIAEKDYTDQERPFGETFKRRDETLPRLQRRIDSTWRQFNQALRTLHRLQSCGPVETAPDEPLDPVGPQIGFVPQPPEIPALSSSAPPCLSVKPPSPQVYHTAVIFSKR